MADRTDFEGRLEARLGDHAARSDRPFDAAQIAAAAVASGRRSQMWAAWRWPASVSAPLVLLLVLALLAALAAAAVLSGQPPRLLSDLVAPRVAPSLVAPSAPVVTPMPAATVVPVASVAPPPVPVSDPHTLLLVTRRPAVVASDLCTTVDRVSVDAGAPRDRVIDCAGRVRLRGDGSEAAVQGTKGLDFVELRTGQTTGSIKTGRNTFAIALSPSGRWVQWESCKDYAHGPCSVVLSARDGSNRHDLYRTAGVGYFGFTEWSSDESTVTIPTGDDVFVGKGDGSDLRQQTFDHFQSTRGRAFAWRPDGSAYLYLWGPPTGSCASFCVSEQVDVWAQPVDGGDATNLTNVVPGDLVVAAAVSPDGRSLALLKKHADPTGDPYAFSQAASALPAELWIRDATGAGRRIETPNLLPIDYGRDMPYSIHWSPDGRHLAIEVSNGRRGAETSTDTYLVPLDGSTVAVLHDAREAAWSPDGTLIAFMHQTGPSSRLENDPVPPRTTEVAASDGSARRQVARPTGDLDAGYFVWAPS